MPKLKVQNLIATAITFSITLFFIVENLTAQLLAVHPQVSVGSFASLPANSARPVCLSELPNGNLFYSTLDGDLFEIIDQQAVLKFTANDHNLSYVSHMEVWQDKVYLCGSVLQTGDTILIGYVVEGDLTNNTWRSLAESAPHYIGNGFKDHRFSSLLVSLDGKHVYVHCGTRTNAGEIHQLANTSQTAGLREEPIRTNLFKLPTTLDTTIYVPNDRLALANSGLVYVTGLRHLFAMAWGTDNNFYGGSNSDRRDVPEAFYKIQQGRHYGFPWWIGGALNPLQFSDYDPSSDRLLPSGANNQGYYNFTAGFPTMPAEIEFVQPYYNIGPDADNYRRADNGRIEDASDNNIGITSFSGHRSPTGLIFDRNNELPIPFSNNGFMVSYSDNDRLLEDDGHDLIMIELLNGDTLSATQLIAGFKHPMDVIVQDSVLYVLEMGNSNGSGRHIYRVEMNSVATHAKNISQNLHFYPNPVRETLRFEMQAPYRIREIKIMDVGGRIVESIQPNGNVLDVSHLTAQSYLLVFRFTDNQQHTYQMIKAE